MMPDEKNVTPDHADSDGAAPSYRGLKALVIGLGLCIVAMLGLIFYTIGERAAESILAEQEGASEAAAVTTVSPVPLAELEVARPAGADLVSASLEGRTLLLQFKAEGGDILIILDRATGEQTRVTIPN